MAGNAPRRLAVFGSPIEHSKSPDLHAAAYRALGLDWVYDRREVEVAQLADLVQALGPEWRGLSLTMPLKQQAFALSQTLDHTAQVTGAVNTLLLDETSGPRIHGFNTDVAGIVGALKDSGTTRVGHGLVLGAGATAASALAAMTELGARDITVSARSAARAEPLYDVADALGVALHVRELASGWSGLDDVDALISTLPGTASLEHPPPAELVTRTTLLDVAYDPWPSTLGQRWTEHGSRAASGLDMLVHQALVQVRIFVLGDPLAVLPDEAAILDAMFGAVGISRPGT
jgi:shikimate dehydrogenase